MGTKRDSSETITISSNWNWTFIMKSNYPQEYLESAHDQGYRDFWDDVDIPPEGYPLPEKREWTKGWKKAQREQKSSDR